MDTVLVKSNGPVIGEGSAGTSSLLSKENLEWHNATHRKVREMVQIHCVRFELTWCPPDGRVLRSNTDLRRKCSSSRDTNV